jgi:alkylhydroperoxidase family enzyme
MARLRFLEGREAGILARVVQGIFRAALGRELNPYKVAARSSAVLLSYFLSNTLLTRGKLALEPRLRSLARIRVASLNGCFF